MADKAMKGRTADESSRPGPRKPLHEATVWLDYLTGAGVDDDGRPVEPILGGRRTKPRLVDLLETARHHHARRLMLSGELPTSPKDWLLPDEKTAARGTVWTPGWDTGRGRRSHRRGRRLGVPDPCPGPSR